ncbi:hypothetical protein [Pseudonocardia sp.]|nr:hypothetical protein [Pseudonocardia sp.]
MTAPAAPAEVRDSCTWPARRGFGRPVTRAGEIDEKALRALLEGS